MSLLSASLDATRHRVRTALSRSDILRRLISLASWTLVSFGLEKGAAIVVVFFLARILGAEDYGRLTLAQGMVNTLQIVVVLGAGAVLGRYVPALRQEGVRRAVEIINLCALVVLGASAIFVVAALTFGRSTTLAMLDLTAASPVPAWIMAWVVLAAGVNLLMTILLSFERGRALGLVSLFGAVVSIALVPALAVSYGLTGAVIGLVSVEALKLIALATLYGRLAVAEGVPVLARPRRADLALLVTFGGPAFLTSALWAPTMWLAQLLVSRYAPDGMSNVGVFGFTNSVLGAVILISSLTNRAALPILVSLHTEGRMTELRRVSWLMALVQFAAASVIAVPLALAAPWIMSLVGPTFLAQWPVLVIMIVTGVLISAQTALGNYLLVTDRQMFLLLTMVGWSAAVIGLTFGLLGLGASGLSWALLFGAILRTGAIAFSFLLPPRRTR